MSIINRFGFPLSLCGAGLLWGWSFLYFFYCQMELTYLADGVANLFYLGSAVILSALVVLLNSNIVFVKRHLLAASLGCALLVVGTVLVAVSRQMPLPDAAIMLGNASAGMGQALFWMAWGELTSRFEISKVEIAVVGWLPVLTGVFVLAALFGSILPVEEWLVPALILLPVASLLAMAHAVNGDSYPSVPAKAPHSDESIGGKETETDSARLPGDLARGAASIIFAFFAVRLVWDEVFGSADGGFISTVPAFSVSAIILFVIMCRMLNSTNRFGLSTLYVWAFPLFVIGVAFTRMPGVGSGAAAFLCLATVNLGLEIMSKLYFIHMAQRFRKHEAAVIALVFSAGGVGGIASIAFKWVSEHAGISSGGEFVLYSALIVFSLVMSFAMREASLRPLLVPEGVESEKSSSQSEAAYGAKCRAIVDRYKLSAREGDVLELLAQGRSRTYIREALYISKGTVDTHVHHIYSKMGISSKDELMKMVIDESE